MRALRFLPVVLLAALLWFLFFGELGSSWLAGRLHGDGDLGPSLGRIVGATGKFKRIHGGGVYEFSAPLKEPVALYSGDRVETHRDSSVTLVFHSQDEMELGPLGSITTHLWNPKDAASPVYIHLSLGELTSRKTGVRGKAYVVKDGRLYLPGQKPSEKPMALTVLRNAPLELHLADQVEDSAGAGEDFENDEDDTTEDPPAAPFGSEPQTLSNEYIDEMIASRQGLLQKCWLGRLKDNPKLRGQIVVQFEISRRGKVRELNVVDATFEDETLKRCVVSVIERISFRSFTGPEISISYPITFE